MQLIYRGQTFAYTPTPVATYHKPYALNWRYQVPGETYGDLPRTISPPRPPQGLNWRYQINLRG
jgi:hypothetical protein